MVQLFGFSNNFPKSNLFSKLEIYENEKRRQARRSLLFNGRTGGGTRVARVERCVAKDALLDGEPARARSRVAGRTRGGFEGRGGAWTAHVLDDLWG